MSKTVARLLLRAYPAEFRDEYGPDALQLVEDRWSHERGAWQRARLCLDLAGDLLATQWHVRRALQPMPRARGAGAIFHAFERDSDAGTMLPGMVLSLLMMVVFVRVITPEGDRDLAVLLQTFSEILRAL